MSVINTNITSMIGQSNLNKSQNALQTSMERLSSGLRINSAKDDAAGQAIANRMSSQITGLAQAQRNANDGISISQTAEGGLNQVNDNLQRIRELTVQAQNGTNSESDLGSIQDEITQRLDEIDRISRETDFNGTRVLSDGAESLSIQVGAQDGQTIEINLTEISANTLNLANFNVTNETLDTSTLSASPVTETVAADLNLEDVSFNNTAAAASYTFAVDDADPSIVYAVNGDDEAWIGTYNSTTGALEFDTSGAADVADITAAAASAVSGTDGVDVGGGVTIQAEDLVAQDLNPNTDPQLYVDDAGDFFVSSDGTNFRAATVDFDTTSDTYGQVSYDGSIATAAVGGAGGPATGVSAVLDTVSNPTESVPIDASGLSAAVVGDDPQVFSQDGGGYVVQGEVDGQTVYYQAEVDEETGVVTIAQDADGQNIQLNQDPLESLDNALAQVDSLRSELGAVQNRFESAITNLNTNETNLSAARSRIEDADYAVEVADMTRAQILQQAGTSVLAQANQLPQNVLSLLG